MDIAHRRWLCQLIEKMEANEEESKRLGLVNRTSFHGQIVNQSKER